MRLTKSDLRQIIRECLHEEFAKAEDASQAECAADLKDKAPDNPATEVEEGLAEGIFGNKYKGMDILVYRGNGQDTAVAIAGKGDRDFHLIKFKKAHAKKTHADVSEYAVVAATDMAVKRYKKDLKSAIDVTDELPQWVRQYVADEKVQADKDFRHAELRKKREAEAKAGVNRANYQRQGQGADDDYTYVQGNGTGTFKYDTCESLALEEYDGDDMLEGIFDGLFGRGKK